MTKFIVYSTNYVARITNNCPKRINGNNSLVNNPIIFMQFFYHKEIKNQKKKRNIKQSNERNRYHITSLVKKIRD